MKANIKHYRWVTFSYFIEIYESSLMDFIKKEEYKKFIIYEDMQIYEYVWSYYMLELENKELYINLINMFLVNFKPKWPFCEIESNWNHFPEILCYWENNWLYYILVEAHEKLNKNIDKELWVYKWVILNPILYLK